MSENNYEAGNVKISEDVVVILADKAIKDIEGVAGLSGSFADSVAVALGKKSGVKGIGADIKDGKAVIAMHLVIKFGFRIPEIAWKVQEAVKTTVESMTGLEVTKVNVFVDDVKFPEDEILPEADGETDEPDEE